MEEESVTAGVSRSRRGSLFIIKFTNERRKNAISHQAYTVIRQWLQEASTDDDVRMTVLTGAGDQYYSSGFDMRDALERPATEDALQENVLGLRELVSGLIDHPKPLVAVVNGHAFGIAVTTLALCDLVYIREDATLCTPFSRLGLCAEGCSSYTFPLFMGWAQAAEVLLGGRVLTAAEAQERGLATAVYTTGQEHQVWERLQRYADLPAASLQVSKALMRAHHRDHLHRANRLETQQLITRFTSEDFLENLVRFANVKKTTNSKY